MTPCTLEVGLPSSLDAAANTGHMEPDVTTITLSLLGAGNNKGLYRAPCPQLHGGCSLCTSEDTRDGF